jgi:hypothetical protein
MPTQNVGTLIGAAIRPIDDAMPIASAFSFEINGGHHPVATLVARDAIIVQRRQWGMLCTVYNDSTSTNNATYQLQYGYNSTNTMDNANWTVFSGGSGGGGGGSSNWTDPVLSVTMSTPGISADGDRYLVGLDDSAILSGSFATLTNTGYSGNLVGGYVAEYKSSISTWVTTLPTDGMTLRVNDTDNSFYRYEGTYSTGQWYKERVNQVRYLSAASTNGIDYTIATGDFFTYSTELVYLVQFGTANAGSASTLNINGLGQKSMRKQNALGLSDFSKNDLNTVGVYNLIYDGTIFRIDQQAGDGGAFTLKYRIIPSERIEVPAYSEYLLYGDLEVNGILDINATGKVVIINGALNVNGGTVSNSGNIHLITFATSSTVSTGLQKYTEVLTPMTMGTTYSIAHNLNTTATVVSTWDEATGEIITIDVVKTTSNNIDISTTTTLSSVRIVVVG